MQHMKKYLLFIFASLALTGCGNPEGSPVALNNYSAPIAPIVGAQESAGTTATDDAAGNPPATQSVPAPSPEYQLSLLKEMNVVDKNQNLLSVLTPDELANLKTIITVVMQDPTMPTPMVYARFWDIWSKFNLTKAQLEMVRLKLVGATADYQKLFWQDAAISLESGRPYKSPERDQMERLLIKEGLPQSRITQNNDFIEHVASGSPIQTPNGNMSVDENIIRQTQQNIDAIVARMDTLFTPPKALP